MEIKKLLRDKNVSMLMYKLANDALLLMMIALAGMLVSEGILPGFVFAHISLLKITLVILAAIALIAYLGNNIGIEYGSSPMQKNHLIPLFVIFSFLLIGNSMLMFPFWENLVITLATLLVFFLFYQLIFHPKKEDE